jgi:hypothetical protein
VLAVLDEVARKLAASTLNFERQDGSEPTSKVAAEIADDK